MPATFFTLVNKVYFTSVGAIGEEKSDFFALRGAAGGQVSETLSKTIHLINEDTLLCW